MQNVDRRSALALGLAAASTAVVNSAVAQTAGSPTETSPSPGVVVRSYGEERSLIPGFKTVVMRDVILQPGAKTKEDTEMMNAMVCHRAELRASSRARWKTVYGQEELRVDMQHGHEGARSQ
jgi:hypothetical protein